MLRWQTKDGEESGTERTKQKKRIENGGHPYGFVWRAGQNGGKLTTQTDRADGPGSIRSQALVGQTQAGGVQFSGAHAQPTQCSRQHPRARPILDMEEADEEKRGGQLWSSVV